MRKSLALALVFLALLLGCQGGPEAAPLLPPGLEEALAPDVPLLGFAYVNQGQSFKLSGETLGLPRSVSVDLASLWVLSQEAFAASLTLASEEEARILLEALPAQKNRWAQVSGRNLYLVWGEGPEPGAGREAIVGGRLKKLSEAVPEAMELLKGLPAQPPEKPVAAAFLMVTEELIDSLASRVQADNVQELAGALKQARLEYIGAVLYGKVTQEMGRDISPLSQPNLSLLLLAKSSYPSFVMNILFGSVAGRMGGSKAELGDTSVYSFKPPQGSLLVQAKGGHIYLSLASSQERAGALLLSALKK